MAAKNTQLNTPTTGTRTGVRFLKHGILASAQTVRLTAAPAPSQGPYGVGKYDLTFALDGQTFVLTVSAKNPQWAALIEAFGEPGDAWLGATVMVSDGTALKTVNVVPIADAKGNAVA